MRKGIRKRLDGLESLIAGLLADNSYLRTGFAELCPHPVLQFEGVGANSEGVEGLGQMYFRCPQCRKFWAKNREDVLADARLRTIAEACGALEPEAEKGVEAGQRMAEAMCAWANAHRAPAAQPFTVTDFVPQACPD